PGAPGQGGGAQAANRNSVGIMALPGGQVTTIEQIASFRLPAESSQWVALQKGRAGAGGGRNGGGGGGRAGGGGGRGAGGGGGQQAAAAAAPPAGAAGAGQAPAGGRGAGPATPQEKTKQPGKD